MRRIIEIISPHWRRLVLAGVCSAVISGLNGSLALIVKPVVDDIFIKGEMSYLIMIAVAVMGVFVFRGVFGFFQNYLMNSIGARIVRDLRTALYRHLVSLPMGFYAVDTTGAMMSRVITDTGLLQGLLAFRVKDLLLSTGTIVALAGVAMYRRWDLTLIALVVLPFAFYLVERLSRRLKRVSRSAQRKIAELTSSMSEGLRGVKVVKSFNMEAREAEKFGRKNRDYYREFMRGIRIMETTSLVMEVVAGSGVAFIIYYGGSLVASGAMTSGDFFSFLTAIIMIYAPAKRLAQVHNGLQQAGAYIERIDDVLEEKREPEGRTELAGFSKDINFAGVSFRYESRAEDALLDVDIRVRRGEVIALVGRSGAGKTTLMDLLAGFYIPQGGKITMDGVDIRDATLRSLRAQIGIVGQNVMLFNDTVRANIAFGDDDTPEERIEEAARAAFAHEFITQLPQGYETPLGEGGATLSGGQRQRISIARAILKDPAILILDEATSALDTQSEIMVQKALNGLILKGNGKSGPVSGPAGDGGRKTIFIIAHRLSTIKRADRIIVLDRGRVVESGTHEELLLMDGLYRRLHNMQYGLEEGGVDPDLGL